MYVKQIISAVAALSLASGAVALGCQDPTATISSAADATAIAQCTSFPGSVVLDQGLAGVVDMSGQLSEIGGDFVAKNVSGLIGFSSRTIKKIGGAFQLEQLKLLSNLNMAALTSVKSISWVSLPQLGAYTTTGNGITEASSVLIADTFLSSLDGINVRSCAAMDINNNKRLTKFLTQLGNLTDTLNINANGLNLDVSMPNLIWIANATISNVTSFSAQSLAAVNGSLRFDSNYFESFVAPNLTMVDTGDLSFVSNPKATNISFPLLQRIGGGLTVANNTALGSINGFPALTQVGGAIKVRGSMENMTFPKLNDVKGAFSATSTKDITNACGPLQTLKNGGQIQGDFNCKQDSQSNNDTSSAGGGSGSGSGSGSGGSGTGNKPNNAPAGLTTSISTVVTLAALGALVTAFL